ncbi:MAG: LacI family DNA-binding transcriptional regulator [Ramlibacter sp.]
MATRSPSAASTIKHVAARAGVSYTTVSHVLNGTRRVSDDARRRVEQAARELAYAPSAVARALKNSRTRMLGVLVPNITNPFFAELTRGIEDCCHRAEYAVFLCNSDDAPERQAKYLQTLVERRVDGLLLAAPAGDTEHLVQRLQAMHVPLVVIDRELPGLPANLVHVDHHAGAKLAVQHLVALGHRRIACLSGPSNFAVSRLRAAGWREALAAAGIAPDAGLWLEGDFDAAVGHALARQVLARGDVTAIVAGNDLMAIGALRAAAELGLAVPQAVSVIGFDSIDLGAYAYPPLTTVGHRIGAIGEAAASLLLQVLEQPASAPAEVTLPAYLVERASTGPAPRKAGRP